MPGKYAKNIRTEPLTDEQRKAKGLIVRPRVRGSKGGALLWIDDDFVKGAFYMEVVQVPAGIGRDPGIKPHSHEYNEIIGFTGTNPDDPHDLGGEVEIWLDDEPYIITQNALVFIPKGLKHCPLRFPRLERRIVHFTVTNGSHYEKAKVYE